MGAHAPFAFAHAISLPTPICTPNSFTPHSRRLCPSHGPPCAQPVRRAPIWARTRRGFKPEPRIPDTVFDADPMKDIDFQPFDFSTLRGKVVFALNVASEDVYSKSTYTQLAHLLDKYYDDGLRVLAFPNNWFGQKETGTHHEIKRFVHENYSDKIVLFAKADVDWNQVLALGVHYFPGEIVWNFHGKFLCGKEGKPVDRFDLLTTWDYIDGCVQRELYKQDVHPPTSEEEKSEAGVEQEAEV